MEYRIDVVWFGEDEFTLIVQEENNGKQIFRVVGNECMFNEIWKIVLEIVKQ